MGVTVKKLPTVKLFDGCFDERTYFESDKAPIKVPNVLDLIYSMLSERTYKKLNNEIIEEYDDKVDRLIAYSTNNKSNKHYQCYEKQYQDYTKKQSKLELDSL
eukprot:10526770-Ditylum_brightwellii.AAC.1